LPERQGNLRMILDEWASVTRYICL
jgi:hypothetical protein